MADELTDLTFLSRHTGEQIDAAVDAIKTHIVDEDRHVNAELKKLILGIAEGTNAEEVVFLKRSEFPGTGDPDRLYIAVDENTIYRFDEDQNTYLQISADPDMIEYYTKEQVDSLIDKVGKPLADLKPVAFTGSYNDLTDIPNYAGSSSPGGSANTAEKLNATRTIDGVDFDGSDAICHYGKCSTAAATVNKVVTLAGFKLVTGAKITVIFGNLNSANNITLNVNGTGAKPVYYRGEAMTYATLKLPSQVGHDFIYNGTNWIYSSTQDYVIQADSTDNLDFRILLSDSEQDRYERTGTHKSSKFTANPSTGELKAPKFTGELNGNASTAAKLATARKINGVAFDGTEDITIPCSLAGGLLASGDADPTTGFTAEITDLAKRNSLLAEVTVKDSSNSLFYVSLTIPVAYITSGETFIASRVVTNGSRSYSQVFHVTATGNSINIKQVAGQSTTVSKAEIYSLS